MRKNRLRWWVLLSVCAFIKGFSLFPDAVEKYYSQGFYPFWSRLLRLLFGWIPFSIGDIFYALLILWLIRGAYRIIRDVQQKKTNRSYWMLLFKQTAFVSLCLYVVFNLFWGLNYNRRGIAWQLELGNAPIGKEDLVAVMQALVVKVNELDTAAHTGRGEVQHKQPLFSKSVNAYEVLSEKDSRFSYPAVSLKPSLFSYLGNYLGYTGYYNPITGEAQVNTTVPLFVQPFTSCHEIGHQLGYAKENEANFAGYLAASNSPDPVFRYSVYFDLYSYGRPYLYYQDSMLLKKLDSSLNKGVRNDFRELKEFYKKHENPIEVIIDRLYGQYLKANEQPDGKVTYGKVMVWLVAYYKKNRRI